MNETRVKIIILSIIATLFSAVCLDAQNLAVPLNKQIKPYISRKDTAKTLKSLEREINKILNSRKLRSASIGVAVYSLDNKKFYYKKNIDKAFTPASNTKLFTTITALLAMGERALVRTSVYTDADRIDSVLRGNLYLVGGGDALLSDEDVEIIAEDISLLGIKRVTGDVYADPTYFDNMTERMDYARDNDRVERLAPISGLGIEENKATVRVSSGPYRGDKVNVQIIPDSDYFIKNVNAKVKYGKKRSNKKSSVNIEKFHRQTKTDMEYQPQKWGCAPPAPEPPRRRRTIRVSSRFTDDGKQRFTISGYLKANRTVSYAYYMKEPDLIAAGTLKKKLELFGVAVDGDIARKPLYEIDSGKTAKLVAQFSRPLTEFLEPVNKDSDNFLAEHLYKMIGAYGAYFDDNAIGTQKIMNALLPRYGIPIDNCKLNDGSGLSRRNLLTPRAIIAALETAYQSPFFETFRSSLSVAGLDGTLRKRMRNSPAEFNLRGKTGTLRNVSALSGYVKTLDGENLAFSFLFNGRYVSSYKSMENDLGELLAQFFFFNEEN